MRKKLLFVALVAAGCLCRISHAQSSVTLYGVIDNGIEYQNGGKGTAVRAVSSGLYATVYGFKGSENLGDGNSINFHLEQGFSGVTGAQSDATAAFNRLAWIGAAGAFGEFRLGRQKKPQYQLLNDEMDPTGIKSIASPIINFTSVSVRASNAISYFTPTVNGLIAQAMISLREDGNTPSVGILMYNGVVRYVNGPLRASVGYEHASNAAGTSMMKVFRSVGSYRVGDARLYLAYQSEHQSDNTEKRDLYSSAVSYSMTPASELSFLYGYEHDRTGQGNNAQQVGMLYEYSLSRTTGFYSAAGLIQNRNKAQFTLNGTQYDGVAVAPGAYARGLIVGMTHRF